MHECCIKWNWENTESVRAHFIMLLLVAKSYGTVEGGRYVFEMYSRTGGGKEKTALIKRYCEFGRCQLW